MRLTHFLRRAFATPLDILFWAGCACMLLGVAWAVWPAHGYDPAYRPRVQQPVYRWARGPRVLFDEGHWNAATAAGSHAPFAHLLGLDGYRVARSKQPITPSLLETADVLIIADALGFQGRLQRIANEAGLEGRIRLGASAFARHEVETLVKWVERGGALLLAAGPGPASNASRALAAAFGVKMTGWYAEDRSRTLAGKAGFVEFREGAGLTDHAILAGRPEVEQERPVRRVAVFGGQALSGPEGSAFLVLGPAAREFPSTSAETLQGRSAEGKSQGVAFLFGRGRVAVVGGSSGLTAQLEQREGQSFRLGINMADTENQQLALNIVRWLSRAL